MIVIDKGQFNFKILTIFRGDTIYNSHIASYFKLMICILLLVIFVRLVLDESNSLLRPQSFSYQSPWGESPHGD